MDESVAILVARAERYAIASGLALATVSGRIFADSKRIDALKAGAGITMSRFRRSEAILEALEKELSDRLRRSEAAA